MIVVASIEYPGGASKRAPHDNHDNHVLDTAQSSDTMPKILSHTPAWLCRPSAGFDLFTKTSSKSSSAPRLARQTSSESDTAVGPRRTIARRGTEIFVALDNQIRWADLVYVKGQWEQREIQTQRAGQQRRTGLEGSDGDELDDFSGAIFRVCLHRLAG